MTKTQAQVKDLPVQFGEPIPGTNLIKRYQGGRELYPQYVASRTHMTTGEMCDEAETQAEAAGYKGVVVWDTLYVKLFGDWYVWA